MKALATLLAVLALVALALYFGGYRGSAAGRPSAEIPAGATDNDPNKAQPIAKPDAELSTKLVGQWRSLDERTLALTFEVNGKYHYDYDNGGFTGYPGSWSIPADGSADLLMVSEGAFLRYRVAVSDDTLQLDHVDSSDGGPKRFERVR